MADLTTTTTTATPEKTVLIGDKRMTYQQYKRAVDLVLIGKVGVGSDDLTDFDLFSAWEHGESPTEAAHDLLEFDGTADEDFMDELFEDDDWS